MPSPDHSKSNRRQAEIIACRLEGLSWDEISQQCLVSATEASHIFHEIQEQAGDPQDALRPSLFALIKLAKDTLDEDYEGNSVKERLSMRLKSNMIPHRDECSGCGRPSRVSSLDWVPPYYTRVEQNAYQILDAVLQQCDLCSLLASIMIWASTFYKRSIALIVHTPRDGYTLPLILHNRKTALDEEFALYSHRTDETTPFSKSILPTDLAFWPVRNNPASRHCLDLARGWLRECEGSHSQCRVVTVTETPTRVLLLSNSKSCLEVKLVQFPKSLPRYAALSHSWGKCQEFKLTLQNLEELEAEIRWKDLPQTFKDAAFICQSLGIQYLWVDSLCILQDSKEDWVSESARMGGVYNNAAIVLGASSSSGDEQGFLGLRNDSLDTENFDIITSFATAVGDSTTTIHLSPSILHYSRQTRQEPLAQRAWTFQERLLARRFLSFNKREIHWECNTTWYCECGASDYHNKKSHDYDLRNTLNKSQASLYRHWYHVILDKYSGRNLSKQSDRLPAISAVAKIFMARLNDEYLAGLWKNDLIYGMLWMALDYGDGDFPRSRTSCAPSWSWASIESPISYWKEKKLNPIARVLDSGCELSSANPTGEVKSGLITFSGPIAKASVRFPSPEPLRRSSLSMGVYQDGVFFDVGRMDVDCLLGKSHMPNWLQGLHEQESCLVRMNADTIIECSGASRDSTSVYQCSDDNPSVWCVYIGFADSGHDSDASSNDSGVGGYNHNRDNGNNDDFDDRSRDDNDNGSNHLQTDSSIMIREGSHFESKDHEGENDVVMEKERTSSHHIGHGDSEIEKSTSGRDSVPIDGEETGENEASDSNWVRHFFLVLGPCMDQPNKFNRLGFSCAYGKTVGLLLSIAEEGTITVV